MFRTVSAEADNIGRCVFQVGTGTYFRDGDFGRVVQQDRVIEITALQDFCKRLAYLFTDTELSL